MKEQYELKIDDEFKNALPPLTDAEFTLLETNVVENGCEMPLVVWNGVIVDGHNRYKICRKHNIPFAVEEKSFSSKDEAELWIVQNQIGRRNLSPFSKCEMVLRFEPILSAEAKKRQGKRTDIHGEDRLNYFRNTRDILADMAGVSSGQISKAKVIIREGDNETKRKLRNGEISIHFAYTMIRAKDKEEEQQAKDQQKYAVPSSEAPIEILNEVPVEKPFEYIVPPSDDPQITASGIDRIKLELGILANEVLVGDMNRDVMMRSIQVISEVVRG